MMTSQFDRLQRAIRALEDPRSDALARDAMSQAAQERCTVALLGEWSRGKSSLLNALIDRPLLPTDVRPTTAGIVSITYGAEPAAHVELSDGTLSPCPVSSEALRAVQTRDTGGTEQARSASISLPIPRLQEFRLVDTPGVNDLAELADEVLYTVLPHVDLAVVVLDGTNGGMSRSEEEFLRARLLGDFQPPFAVVVGHWDRVDFEDDDEEEELTEAFVDAVVEVLGKDTPVVFGTCAGPNAEATAAALWAHFDERAAESRERRRARVFAQCQEALRTRVRELCSLTDATAKDLDAKVAILTQARQYLPATLDAFRAHVRAVGEGPLCELIRTSLLRHAEHTQGDVLRRVALASDLGRYAEHGLLADVEAASRAWSQRHAPEVATFLRRHLEFVRVEFQRAFGTALGADLATLRIQMPPADPLPEIDSVAVRERQSNTESSRYVLPGVLTVVGSLIAAPLGIAGLYVGMHLARKQQRAEEEALRAELSTSAQALVQADVRRMEQQLDTAVQQYFADLDAQLAQSFAGLLDERERQLEAAQTLHAQGSVSLEKRRTDLRDALQAIEAIEAP